MNRIVIAGNQLIICKLFSCLDFRGSCPCRVIISSLCPAFYCCLFGSVVSFSLEKRCQTYRAIVVVGPAAVIGYNDVTGAVCIVDNQFCHKGWLIAIIVIIQAFKCGHSCPPALAKDCTHCVFPGLKVIGNVIRVVCQNGIVLCGAWIEPFIWCHFLSVNIEIIDTLCGQVKSCRLDLGFCFEIGTHHRCCRIGGICISKNTCVTAIYSNCISIYSYAVHSVKNRIGCTGFCVQKGSGCISSAVFNFVICKCGSVACICCKTYGIQVRECISIFHGINQDIIAHFCTVYGNSQCTCGTEDVDGVRFVFVLICNQGIQIFVILNGEKWSGRIVIFCIAHAVSIDLSSAVCINTGQIKLYANVVLAFLHFTVEYLVFQTEIVCAKNKGSCVAAFCYLYICGNIEYCLGCGIKLKFACTDPLRSIPGSCGSIQQTCFKGCILRLDGVVIVVGYGYRPAVFCCRSQPASFVFNLVGFTAFHYTGIPYYISFRILYYDLVRFLGCANLSRLHLPGKSRLLGIHANWVGASLGFQIYNCGFCE